MAVARGSWPEFFTELELESIPCSQCGNGYLTIKTLSTDKIKLQECYVYDELQTVPNLERFISLLVCSFCGLDYDVIGYAKYCKIQYKRDDGIIVEDYRTKYSPIFFYPAPHLIRFGINIPAVITIELIKAFSFFWQDYSACGNRIRIALEKLLDKLHIPRISHEKKRTITLHKRIEEFKIRKPKYAQLSDELLAIKWLGNEGSHTTNLTREDIFDPLDLLGYVLDEIFHDKTNKIKSLSKKINKKKGSIYPKRKSKIEI